MWKAKAKGLQVAIYSVRRRRFIAINKNKTHNQTKHTDIRNREIGSREASARLGTYIQFHFVRSNTEAHKYPGWNRYQGYHYLSSFFVTPWHSMRIYFSSIQQKLIAETIDLLSIWAILAMGRAQRTCNANSPYVFLVLKTHMYLMIFTIPQYCHYDLISRIN